MQNPYRRRRLRCTARLIISTSVWNWISPPAALASLSLLTATTVPSWRYPLYTFPKPPLPTKFLLLKLCVADWSSLKWNDFKFPRQTSSWRDSEISIGVSKYRFLLVFVWLNSVYFLNTNRWRLRIFAGCAFASTKEGNRNQGLEGRCSLGLMQRLRQFYGF